MVYKYNLHLRYFRQILASSFTDKILTYLFVFFIAFYATAALILRAI